MNLRTLGCRAAAVACAVFALASCGGAAPGAAPAGPGGAASALANLEMTTSAATIAAKSGETATITITAIDASRRALPDIPISLSANSGVLTGTGTKTDAQGKMTVTYGLGADRGNRDVTVTATSGEVTSTALLKVEGTTLSLTASPPTAVSGATPVQITATVVDAANVPVPGITVNFTTTGGTLASAVAVTDPSGVAKTTLTGVTANVTVSATGANASSQTSVQAGNSDAPPIQPPGVTVKDLSVQVNPSVVAPNAPGSQANFAQLEVRVLGDAPSVPPALGIPVGNAPVRFRIASSPPFGTLSVDTSTAPVLSNLAGLVSARFIPGEATTGTDQVVICASVDNVANLPIGVGEVRVPCNVNEKPVRLTVSQQPLFVRISTNNEILKVNNNLDYEKLFSIYVTDAAGRGVPGANVSVRLLPLPDRLISDPFYADNPPPAIGEPARRILRAYRKGCMVYTGSQWVRAINCDSPMPTPTDEPIQCNNEDKNFNGILDTGDIDLNNDGKLYPGQSAAFTLDTAGVTDSSGFVVLRIRHGQRFAFWATYQIEARASTAGTERLTTMDDTLSAAAEDVESQSTPGFAVSPFGTVQNCSSPN
jgi:hypothetical protein